jgi:Type IV secretion system pilin
MTFRTTKIWSILTSFSLILCSYVLSVLPVLAQTGVTPGVQSQPSRVINPIKVNSIADLLEAILNIVIVLATPFIVFFIIYAGFLYVTARGNAEQVKQASNALLYAVIGGVIIIGSVAIATIVKNLVGSFQ